MTETAFKKLVLKDLKRLDNIWVLKSQERSRRGVPDILICLAGKFIAIELKREGEKPTPLQNHVIDQIRDAGGTSFFTMPSLWELHFSMLQSL